jgi:hypothetical protein
MIARVTTDQKEMNQNLKETHIPARYPQLDKRGWLEHPHNLQKANDTYFSSFFSFFRAVLNELMEGT